MPMSLAPNTETHRRDGPTEEKEEVEGERGRTWSGHRKEADRKPAYSPAKATPTYLPPPQPRNGECTLG